MADIIPRKTMTFPNGETKDDVPTFIDNYEDYQTFKNSFSGLDDRRKQRDIEPEPREAEEYGGFGRDVKRVYHAVVGQPADFLEANIPINAFANPFASARDMYGEDFYDLNLGDRMEKVRTARAKKVSESNLGSWVNPDLEELDRVIDKDGYSVPTETTSGTLLNVGSYVMGGIGIINGARRLATNSPRAFSQFTKKHNIATDIAGGIATGVATDQWITNPNEGSISSVLLDSLEIPDSALLGLGEYLNKYGEYLQTDEEDSALEKRTKLLLGNLPVELVVGAIAGLTVGAIKGKTGKNLDELTPEEIAEIGIEGLKRTKRETLPKTKATLSSSKVIDDVDETQQVFEQEGTLRGLWQKFTQSRGYNTFAGQDAFETSQQAMRKYNNRARHITGRLQKSINDALKNTDDKGMVDRIYQALTSENKTNKEAFKKLKGKKLVEHIAKTFNLNTDVAKEIAQARKLIDKLSSEIEKFAPAGEIKKSIEKNLNSYLRRSYKQFEDKNFIPAQHVINKAEQHVLKLLQEEEMFKLDAAIKKGDTYKIKTNLNDEAVTIVQDLMSQKQFDLVKGVRSKIFKKRKRIDAPIRELFGEIKNPEDAIILSVDKMSKFYQQAKFLDDMNSIGTRQKWLFDYRPKNMDNLVKLENTGSVKLDGKYTTPRMQKVIMNDEINLFGVSGEKIANPLYKNFLSLKGFANKAATVFSATTHVRNFLGGVQFGLANGINPFPVGIMSEKGFGKSFLTLANETLKSGDESFAKLHEKYLKLGIINTNVRVGDFRALINEGANASNVDNLMAGLSNKVSKGAEQLYVATDDFFKINSFNSELSWLKKAHKNSGRSLESLEKEAADIVKNTMPNYDRVPPGIKALRGMPMGTFVSFPAEILRTSFNIIRQTGKEVFSGNSVLATRGALRGTGITGTAFGFEAISDMGAAKLGWSEDQHKAAQVLTESPWSKVNAKLWSFDEATGKIYVADTKYLDAYNTIKEPLIAIYNELQEGKLNEESLTERGWGAITEGIAPLVTPFVSQAIFTKAASDIWFAINSPEGRTPEGKMLFSPNEDIGDKVGDGAYHLLSSLAPGTIDSVTRLVKGYDEERNPFTGELRYDTEKEWGALLTGIRYREFNPEEQLGFKISEYKKNDEVLPDIYPNYQDGFGTLEDAFKNRQNKRHAIQKELYRTIQASQYFRTDREIRTQLEDRKISKSDARELLDGKFILEDVSTDFIVEISNKVGDSPERLREIRRAFTKLNSDLSRTLLNTPDEEDVINQTTRPNYDKGGVVIVPQAPEEPDQRIDKMTGLPYDQQAGGAFVDEEDRLKFMSGGIQAIVKKIISKGADDVIEDAVSRSAKVADDVVVNEPIKETLPEVTTDSVTDLKPSYERPKGTLKETIPEVQKAYDGLKAGNITSNEYDNIVNNTVYPYESVPIPETNEAMSNALTLAQAKKLNIVFEEGQEVGIRLDINAYLKKAPNNAWVPTIHVGRKAMGHQATVSIKNADFTMPKGNTVSKKESGADFAQKVMEGQSKFPFAQVNGNYINRTTEENYKLAQEALNSDEWIQVGFDPRRHSFFYDRVTGQPIAAAEEVIQVGPLVLAKKATYADRSLYPYATGGKVLASLGRTRRAEGGIFGLLEKGIKKGAAYLGFDDDRQLQISADATDLTKQIAPDKEVTWMHQGSPITTEQLRNLKTNRDQISLSGDEETFDAVNHALFGYESGASPVAAFAGQAKEVYQGAKQAMKGQEWRTELKDMWNNSWGIDQRKQNLSRPEFDMNLAQAIMDTKGRMERGEALQMGRDIIINPRDLAQ